MSALREMLECSELHRADCEGTVAKFTINKGYSGQKTVEAEDFHVDSGYFWFEDAEEKSVVVFSVSKVICVEREK